MAFYFPKFNSIGSIYYILAAGYFTVGHALRLPFRLVPSLLFHTQKVTQLTIAQLKRQEKEMEIERSDMQDTFRLHSLSD